MPPWPRCFGVWPRPPACTCTRWRCWTANEYVCHVWIGQALDSLLGGVPEGMDQEEALECYVHPDDRAAYEAGFPGCTRGSRPRRSTGWSATTASHAGCGSGARRGRPSTARLLVDGIVTDITDRHRVEEQLAEAHTRLAHLAYHDHLTGLPNRAQFQEHLDVALERARREGSSLAVLFIDLDGFKQINDDHGHAAGDAVLRVVGDRLAAATRGRDVVARLGGDEFLMLVNLADPDREALDVLFDRVKEQLHSAVDVEGVRLDVAGSVGGRHLPRRRRNRRRADPCRRSCDVRDQAARPRPRRVAAHISTWISPSCSRTG